MPNQLGKVSVPKDIENGSTQPRREQMIPKVQKRAQNLEAPPKHMHDEQKSTESSHAPPKQVLPMKACYQSKRKDVPPQMQNPPNATCKESYVA